MRLQSATVSECLNTCPGFFLTFVQELCEFSLTSVIELSSLLKTMSSKSCVLDLIPATLITECYDTLLSVITNIVNLSFTTATVPTAFKKEVVDPILEKDSLDHEVYKNFRPISNLSFISKATEKVVAARLNHHLKNASLHVIYQSPYKKGHSTETALAQIHNDILHATDNGEYLILVLLDLSVAFETVDHDILITRLKHRFGITGKALGWIQSYLSRRSQFVKIGTERSSSRNLICRVPQGSALGPILYSMNTSPPMVIISKHNMNYHFYADDSQIYVSFMPSAAGETSASKRHIESCIHEINNWMPGNRLILNHDKTELLVLHACHQPQSLLESILVCTDVIYPSNSAKNIGAWFDTVMSMDKQINSICQSAFYHLRNIAQISKHLSFRHRETLIRAFVIAKIDQYNILLSGLRQDQVRKLQYVQNSAARLLTGSCKHEHITPVLRDLHWLPIHECIRFKILLTFKCLNQLAPSYLSDLLTLSTIMLPS